MMPTTLWMRHGTCRDGLRRPTAHAQPSSPLTAQGAVEARRAASALRERRWQPALVVPSPLRRARQTAAILSRELDAPLAEPVTTFTEWQAPPCVHRMTPSQYPPEYLAWRRQRGGHPDSTLPGGESLRSFANRAMTAAETACRMSRKHGAVLVVSHRLLIGAVAAVHAGHRQPAEIFEYARTFSILPARLWPVSEEQP